MNATARVLALMACVAVGCATAGSGRVSPSGDTVISGTLGKAIVKVTIRTREVDIGKPSDGRPDYSSNSCTYSRYPCSVVEQLRIEIGSSALFVPRSAFSDLSDITRAEVVSTGTTAVLTLYGGDTSEAYVAKIEFTAVRVTKRAVASALEPQQPLQDTVYKDVVVGD